MNSAAAERLRETTPLSEQPHTLPLRHHRDVASASPKEMIPLTRLTENPLQLEDPPGRNVQIVFQHGDKTVELQCRLMPAEESGSEDQDSALGILAAAAAMSTSADNSSDGMSSSTGGEMRIMNNESPNYQNL